MLKSKLTLETEASEMCKRSIVVIDDPEVVGAMKRALDEDKRHRKEFKERLTTM